MLSTAEEARRASDETSLESENKAIKYALDAILEATKVPRKRSVDVPINVENYGHLAILRSRGFSTLSESEFLQKCRSMNLDTYLVTVSWA